MRRRSVLALGAVLVVVVSCSGEGSNTTTAVGGTTVVETSTAAPPTTIAEPSPVVVLVHGSFHTPEATWAELTPILDQRGIEWVTVDLPSAGPDMTSGDVPGLHDDTAAVSEVIERVDGRVVLVGHSYGGFVISEAGEDPKVEHLVFLCAFAPEQGETLMELSASDPPTLLASAIRVEGDLMSVDPGLAADALYGDVEAGLAAAAVAQLVPSTLSTLDQPAGRPAWANTPSSYVICTDDQALDPNRQLEMANRIGAETSELDTSHSPFLSRPDAVADIIESILNQLDG